MNANDTREQFATARASGLRAKDAAHAIGISEGAAIAAHAGTHERGLQAIPLMGPWIELLQSLELCGPLLALTRNESTVHEKTGVYEKLSATGHMGLALGEKIDLRLFFDRWHAGFAVTEAAAKPENPPALSLQFFDAAGVAIHKIFARDTTDRAALQAVIDQHADRSLAPTFSPAAPAEPPAADASIDAKGLEAAWSAMTDTHQFFGLLRKFSVERQQSFRLMEGQHTRRVPSTAVRGLLQEAAFSGTPIMVFVGSPGCIQIHSGPVVRIEPMDIKGAQWLNVLDPGFNLHMREDWIQDVWVVEKPTSDGVVTSVEAFDREGALMAMFFGVRKPGTPELEDWRRLVRGLAQREEAAA